VCYSEESKVRVVDGTECLITQCNFDWDEVAKSRKIGPRLKLNYHSSSTILPGYDYDADFIKLAKYFTNVIGPRIFGRDAANKNIPVLTLHRFHFAIKNLVLHWLYYMFEPDKMRLGYFDLVKSNTVCLIFSAPCGYFSYTKTLMFHYHLHNRGGFGKDSRHVKAAVQAYDLFK
jgi:hypothetical protein